MEPSYSRKVWRRGRGWCSREVWNGYGVECGRLLEMSFGKTYGLVK